MTDPLESIAAEAESGAFRGVDGDGGAVVDEAPSIGQRALELVKPCPEDPLSKTGLWSRGINGFLARRANLKPAEVTIGENVAHCIDHLFPGVGGAGWPPIVSLALSVLDYRALEKRHPDNGKLVRP